MGNVKNSSQTFRIEPYLKGTVRTAADGEHQTIARWF